MRSFLNRWHEICTDQNKTKRLPSYAVTNYWSLCHNNNNNYPILSHHEINMNVSLDLKKIFLLWSSRILIWHLSSYYQISIFNLFPIASIYDQESENAKEAVRRRHVLISNDKSYLCKCQLFRCVSVIHHSLEIIRYLGVLSKSLNHSLLRQNICWISFHWDLYYVRFTSLQRLAIFR